ncbi:hypothetical protein [Nonomuraea turcica]|uniref:hypothetical protein n=1 Tax=Nonomuraea sp. G32 TaxID=3067274 RepID=UPI00273CC5F9|nr:hypothetical protein [Nonomuraea sp. G32]MDP4511737.1 hypothetical protein [Nonomuraea sp. G32]
MESAVVPDSHEWTGANSEDGPGTYWSFRADNPSVAQHWTPDGVTVIWDPLRAGWIDHNRVPLPLDDIADIRDAVQAIKECVTGRKPTTTKEGPRWPLADELEDLIVADLQADDC